MSHAGIRGGLLTLLCILLAWGTSAFAAGVSLASPSSVPPRVPEEVSVSPATPVQGDTLIVLITARAGANVTVRFDGSMVPVFAMSGGIRRALIGTDPDVPTGKHTIAVSVHQDDGAQFQTLRTIHLIAGDFGVRNLTLPPKVFGLINPENLAMERRAIVPALTRRSPHVLWHGPFQPPSSGPMGSPYGYQGMYNGHREWWHAGVDFLAPEGSPVVATNEGVVLLSQLLPLGGGTIIIDHGQGVVSEYLHMSGLDVHVGDHVTQGTVIGKLGATGLATGPNIHWGLFVNGIPVNPLYWLEPHPGLTF
jgi:murein DD-endopeptidase MepM/ murein hydrolase activator NlpD